MRCVKCKLEAVDGKKRCQKHLDLHVIYTRNWQNKQRAKGCCAKCGKPSKSTYCDRCNASRGKTARKYDAKMVSKARCIICTKPAIKGRRKCAKCISRRRIIDRKYRAKLAKEKRCWHCSRPLDEFSLMLNKKSCMVCRIGRRR